MTAKIKRGQQEIKSENSFQPTMYKSQGNNYLFVRIPKSKVRIVLQRILYLISQYQGPRKHLKNGGGGGWGGGGVDGGTAKMGHFKATYTRKRFPAFLYYFK